MGRPARGGKASFGRGARSRLGARHGQLGLRGGAASEARPAAAGSGRGGMSGGCSLARDGWQARRKGAAGLAWPAAIRLGGTAARRWTSGAHGGVAWREEGDERMRCSWSCWATAQHEERSNACELAIRRIPGNGADGGDCRKQSVWPTAEDLVPLPPGTKASRGFCPGGRIPVPKPGQIVLWNRDKWPNL